jgi:hypothetical protein
LTEDSKRDKIGTTFHVTPSKTVSRSNNFGTIASDHAIVTVNEDTQLCTFTFFQTHPIPRMDETKGILVDSIEEEMVLEVKMPFTTGFALAMYMATLIEKEFRGKPRQDRTFFGPVAVKHDMNPTEEK